MSYLKDLRDLTEDGPQLWDRDAAEELIVYGIFNDPEVWEPMFASGELPETLRFNVDEPLEETPNRNEVFRRATTYNEDRAARGEVMKIGKVIVKQRVVLRSAWRPV